jgi:Restriction endonuclease NaeI
MTSYEAMAPSGEPGLPLKGCEDAEQIRRLEEAILRGAGGLARLKKTVPLLLREAIDDVIDAPRTNRSALDQTKINERIYLATKVKVRLRTLLELPRGRVLDVFADGVEAAIQSTIRQTWQIPPAIVGYACVLIKADTKRSVCSVGAVVIRNQTLSSRRSSSGRRTISRAGLSSVSWMLKDEPLPGTSL